MLLVQKQKWYQTGNKTFYALTTNNSTKETNLKSTLLKINQKKK